MAAVVDDLVERCIRRNARFVQTNAKSPSNPHLESQFVVDLAWKKSRTGMLIPIHWQKNEPCSLLLKRLQRKNWDSNYSLADFHMNQMKKNSLHCLLSMVN